MKKPAQVAWKNVSCKARKASIRIRCVEPLRVLQARRYPVEIYQQEHEQQYRVLVLNKAYDEAHRALAARLKGRGVKIVFDLCDNLFYNPNQDPLLEAERNKVAQLIELADVVTVPSAELQRYVPGPSQVIRDGIRPLSPGEMLQRRIWAQLRSRRRCRLVWFGHRGDPRRSGGMLDLLPQKARLIELSRHYAIDLTIISNKKEWFEQHFRGWGFPTYYQEWKSDTHLRRHLARFDVCLIPVSLDPFTACKSNNRLTLPLYLQMPVVADCVPAYQELGPYSVLNDWGQGLEEAVTHRKTSDALNGKRFVEAHYMTRHAADDWQTLFDRMLNS